MREEAISVRERVAGVRAAAAFRAGAQLWLVNQLDLVTLYRDAGQTVKAANTLKRLERDLALADPDNPLALALKRLR